VSVEADKIFSITAVETAASIQSSLVRMVLRVPYVFPVDEILPGRFRIIAALLVRGRRDQIIPCGQMVLTVLFGEQ
jgi:hypothetical protein